MKKDSLIKYLLVKLIIPFLALTFLCIIFIFQFPCWRDVWVNLFTSFLSILLTICFIDVIHRRWEKDRWEGVDKLIHTYIDTYLTVSINQFRTAFKISAKVIDQSAIDFKKSSSIRKEMVRVAETYISPSVDSGVSNMTTTDWNPLIRQLNRTWESGEKITANYIDRVDPILVEQILKIQNEMIGICNFYSTFPDVIGIPDEKLKTNKNGTSSIADKKAMEKVISDKIKNILKIAIDSMNYLGS